MEEKPNHFLRRVHATMEYTKLFSEAMVDIGVALGKYANGLLRLKTTTTVSSQAPNFWIDDIREIKEQAEALKRILDYVIDESNKTITVIQDTINKEYEENPFR